MNYRVTFIGDKATGKGVLTNLTIGGGQIESDVLFAIGAHLCLQVELSGARSPIVIALAIVRWEQEQRYGVEFVRFEGEAKQQLREMLNQHDG